MNKEEFERLKEEEKAHLRQLRALKGQHREAQRKKGLLDALRGMTNPDADATHEEVIGRLTQQNVEAEARFEVAMDAAGLSAEAAARRAQEEADREAVRKAEAEALVRQMKTEIGGPSAAAPPSATALSEPASAVGKTIGRAPAEGTAGTAPPEARDAKTIGRPRQAE